MLPGVKMRDLPKGYGLYSSMHLGHISISYHTAWIVVSSSNSRKWRVILERESSLAIAFFLCFMFVSFRNWSLNVFFVLFLLVCQLIILLRGFIWWLFQPSICEFTSPCLRICLAWHIAEQGMYSCSSLKGHNKLCTNLSKIGKTKIHFWLIWGIMLSKPGCKNL